MGTHRGHVVLGLHLQASKKEGQALNHLIRLLLGRMALQRHVTRRPSKTYWALVIVKIATGFLRLGLLSQLSLLVCLSAHTQALSSRQPARCLTNSVRYDRGKNVYSLCIPAYCCHDLLYFSIACSIPSIDRLYWVSQTRVQAYSADDQGV